MKTWRAVSLKSPRLRALVDYAIGEDMSTVTRVEREQIPVDHWAMLVGL